MNVSSFGGMLIKDLTPYRFELGPRFIVGSDSRKRNVVVVQLSAAIQIHAKCDQESLFANSRALLDVVALGGEVFEARESA